MPTSPVRGGGTIPAPVSLDLHVRWWVQRGAAHLQAPGHGGHPMHDSNAVAWCGARLMRGASEAVYEPRCVECLRELRRYDTSATVALPDLVVEEVVVRVTRPQDSRDSAADVVIAALRRKRSWSEANVRSQIVGGVDD